MVIRLFLCLLFLLASIQPAHALEVKQSDTLPFRESRFSLQSVRDRAEIPSIADTVYEAVYLESVLPFLKEEAWPIYVVDRYCFYGSEQVTGAADRSTFRACLFARDSYSVGFVWIVEKGVFGNFPAGKYLAAHTVAHEVGHLVRFKYFNQDTFWEYLKLRNCPDINDEELFAEDFKWLYGSDRAKAVGYQHKIEPPGDKEKKFMEGVLSIKNEKVGK